MYVKVFVLNLILVTVKATLNGYSTYDGIYSNSEIIVEIDGLSISRNDIITTDPVTGVIEDDILVLPKSWNNEGSKIHLLKHNDNLLEINSIGEHVHWKKK